MDIALAIEAIVPHAQYSGSVTANTAAAYDEIEWTDTRPKPTWAELEAAWPATQEEWAWRDIRDERDRRLADCDWTQLSDSPLASEDRAAWATYRQALRDIPQTAGTPEAVVWPEAPAETE